MDITNIGNITTLKKWKSVHYRATTVPAHLVTCQVLSGLGEGEHQAALSSFVLSQSGQLKVEVEEGTAGEKLLLQGLETCDKVVRGQGEE